MGGHPYWYFAKYDPDTHSVLQRLRAQEFQAGRYNPVIPFPEFPIGPKSRSPGAQHNSILQALEVTAGEGTRSILDLDHVADQPEMCAVAPLSDETLREHYGTALPTRKMVEANMDFLEDVERGQGAYIILYKDGRADEILFAGYSFD